MQLVTINMVEMYLEGQSRSVVVNVWQ